MVETRRQLLGAVGTVAAVLALGGFGCRRRVCPRSPELLKNQYRYCWSTLDARATRCVFCGSTDIWKHRRSQDDARACSSSGCATKQHI